jgi:hypothetical protein
VSIAPQLALFGKCALRRYIFAGLRANFFCGGLAVVNAWDSYLD